MSIVKKYCDIGLIIRIVIGLVIGVVLGLVCPSFTAVGVLGSLFVGALKAIAPLLVFVLVLSAISNSGKGLGSRFRTVIVLYMISTLLAAAAAVIASLAFKVTIDLDISAATNTPPSGIVEILRNLLTNMVGNPIAAIASANYIGILFWAIILGFALKLTAKRNTLDMLQQISDGVSLVVKWVIECAPFGIIGLVFDSVSESGLEIFSSYGRLLVILVGTMLFVALVIDPLIVGLLLKKNPYPLVFRCLKESGVTAFFTRSSAANIPVNMQLCESLGLDREFYSVSIPLGSTINMDGAAVTITVFTLAVCNTIGISVDIPTAIILSVIATLGACGTSGVAGGSLLLIPMACSLFNVSNDIAMQAVAVGFIVGVVQDSVETALNSSADVLFTTTAELFERNKKSR